MSQIADRKGLNIKHSMIQNLEALKTHEILNPGRPPIKFNLGIRLGRTFLRIQHSIVGMDRYGRRKFPMAVSRAGETGRAILSPNRPPRKKGVWG